MENPLRYESFNSDLYSTHSKNAKKLVESMEWKENDVVMNYMCNSDIVFKHLSSNIKKPKCVCGVVDTMGKLRSAYENFKNKDNIYFSIGDIMDKWTWTFKENMVNKFVAYLVLSYVQDYRSFIHKVYDFVKPGGQVGMLVPFSQAIGIPYQLLSQEKWAKYSEKNEMLNHSSFAPWTYSDIDVPSAIKETLLHSGFKIEVFEVEEVKLDFSLRNLCEFLTFLTSALNIVPEKFENEFIEEMMDLVKSNGHTNGIKMNQSGDPSLVSVEWKFLNFVATKM